MAVAREFCAAVKERCDPPASGDGKHDSKSTNPRNIELRAQEADLNARIAELESELAEWERVEANVGIASTAAQQLLDENIATALSAGTVEALDAAESNVAAPRASLARTAEQMLANVRLPLSSLCAPPRNATRAVPRRIPWLTSSFSPPHSGPPLTPFLAPLLLYRHARPVAPATTGGRARRHS